MLHRFFQGIFRLAICGGALLVGCTTSHHGFLENDEPQAALSSKLSPGDTIEVSIEVGGNMEVVSHVAQINPQGVVILPLVGDVKISGSTLEAARQIIAQTYGTYYVHPPLVMLSLTTSSEDGGWGAVTVMGRVVRPGRVPLRNQQGMNLTEVIQQVGGFAVSAKKSGIQVSRTDKTGDKKRVSVNYDAIGKGGDASADIKLIAGDIVYVPERIF